MGMKMHVISAFRSRWILLAICTLHSIWLLVLSYIWLNQPISYADEALLTKYTTILRRLVLGLDDHPPQGRFVFVNVSWAKSLIPKTDAEGLPIGNQPITDRQVLGQFFRQVNTADAHRYLLVDINFDLATEQDSLLRATITHTPRMVASYHRDPNTGKPIRPVFDIPIGLADYTDDFGSFYKFTLLYDSLKTVPVQLYEALHPGTKISGNWLLSWRNGQPILNTFILDFRIRPYHLSTTRKGGYEYYNIQDLQWYSPEELRKALGGKIVVVGDFEDRDIHETMLGNMPGPLILVNALLALEEGDMVINSWFLLFLFITYFFMSLDVFTLHQLRPKARRRDAMEMGEAGKLMGDFFGYFFFLGLASVLSYFLFNIHLNVLLFALYLSSLELVVRIGSRRMRRLERMAKLSRRYRNKN
jgi:hypothetical protein